MRYKIMCTSATLKTTDIWSLGYPTKKSALAAARRLNNESPSTFKVEKMTAEDEALASKLQERE
jgi:hypothetical protein